MPRFPHHHRSSSAEPTPVLRTGGWFRGVQPLTDIDQPDAVQLIAHTPPTTIATQADLELQVLQLIDVLHARGALDRYTANVVDNYVDTRIAADVELIEREAAAARSTNGGLLLSNELGNLTEATERLSYLRETDHRLGTEIEGHRQQLLGDRAAARLGTAPVQQRPPVLLRLIPQSPDLTALRTTAPDQD